MAHTFSFDVDRLRDLAESLWNGDAITPRRSSGSPADDFADELVMVAGACLRMAYMVLEMEAQETGQRFDDEAVSQLMIDLTAGALFCGGIADPDEPYGRTPLVELHCEEFRCRPPELK